MRLHLPKLLRLSLLSTFVMPVMGAALSSSDIKTPVEGGDSYLNVGMENTTDAWTGDLVVGDKNDAQGNVDKVGAFNDSWEFITPNGSNNNTTITSGLKITGNLTLQGSGKIVLGGQYKGGGSYTGLEATESITVTGGSLTSTKIVTKSLNVSGGTVSTSTGNCTSGNGYAGGPKQSYIKESLTISNGSLSFGYTANVQGIGTGGHRMTALGNSSSFTMTQTGGTMRVYGDLDMKSGTTITQSSGTMVLRDTIFMGGSGTTTITQSGADSKLVLGRLESTSAYNDCAFDIKQTGDGLIHLAYGSNFAKDATIKLTQSGNGQINIGGGHDTKITGALPSRGYELDNSPKECINTTYIIDQETGGNINVKKNGLLIAGDADIAGIVTVENQGTLGSAFDSLSGAQTAPVNVETGGSLVMQQGSVFGINFTQNAQTGLTKNENKATTPDAYEFDFKVYAVEGGDSSKLENGFALVDMNERVWSLKSGAHWEREGTASYATGTLVFNPWVELTDEPDGVSSEVFADVNDYLTVGLKISGKNLKLSGKNAHGRGTIIDGGTTGITVTLGNASALGNGPVSTLGTCTLASSSSYTYYNLPGTIQNSGTLTLTGKRYAAERENLTLIDSRKNTMVDVDGRVGQDGFAGTILTYAVISNTSGASLVIQDKTIIQLDGELYYLGNDGSVEVFESLYDTYEMNDTSQNLSVSEIERVAEGSTPVVKLNGGSLIADQSVEVKTTGGSLEVQSTSVVSGEIVGSAIDAQGGEISASITGGTLHTSGEAEVTGSVKDTAITSNGGKLSGDISGNQGVTVNAATTLSGDNTYTGGTNVNGAELNLGSSTALGNGDVSMSGQSSLATETGVAAVVAGTLSVETGSTATLTGDYVLSQSINNNSTLKLNASLDASDLDKEVVDETFICVEGKVGDNGFKRDEGSSIALVNNSGTIVAGDSLKVTHSGMEYTLDEKTGIAYAHGTTHHDTYFINTEEHSVTLSAIQTASNNATTKVEMSNGSLSADGGSIEVSTTGGALIATDSKVSGSIAYTEVDAQGGEISASVAGGSLSIGGGALISGTITDVEITAAGGSIAGEIAGASTVTVTGETTISGKNTYSGDTLVKGDSAKLVLAADGSLGSGRVQLDEHGTLDLGGNAVSNDISVTGCTLAGAGSYTGFLDVTGDLKLQDATTAAAVTIRDNGRISGARLTTTAVTVGTTGDAEVAGDLTINDNGTITLNGGKVLNVGGSLTLGNGTTFVVDADYGVGDTLVTSKSGAITMGTVNLDCNDPTVELELQGDRLVLVSLFKQPLAAAQVLANWGTLTASRAFVNAVHGQRTNTGCIANGRGTAWAAVLGGTHEISSGDINLKGAAVGADMKVGTRSNVGVAFGYIDGDAEPSGLSKVEQEGTYVALYGEHGLKKLSATSCLSLDWVAAYGNTESEQGALDWEQQSLQFNTRLNWNMKVTDRLCVSVFGGLEYYTNESERVANIKTGSLQNLRGEIGVGARYVAWGAPAVFDGKSGLARSGCEKLVFHGELRYMNDMVRSNPVVEINGLRGGADNPGRYGMGIEAGATYRIGERWSTSVNYGFNTMDDSKEHRVNMGASYSF